jgi:UDP-GlcNAc3NAcA epimerase
MRKRRKIGIIIGTRPQFVKLFPLIQECNRRKDEVSYFLIHTGQHFDHSMSDVFFDEMDVVQPQYNLNIHSLPEGLLLGKTIDGIKEIFNLEQPDMVVVFGDSYSTLSGALAAKYSGTPCTHVEAGLRSHNKTMPEEINRVATDAISDLLCCPTDLSLKNVNGKVGGRSINTGDIMLDAYLNSPASTPKMDLGKYILFTVHRRELLEDQEKLNNTIKAINYIDSNYCKVVAPLHPHCKKKLNNYKIHADFIIIPPQPYLSMKSLTMHSRLVITDSGGLQKEAFFSKKFCVTIREDTEWVETLQQGCNTLVGYDQKKLINEVALQLKSRKQFKGDMSLFGKGRSAAKIMDAILQYLQEGEIA